MQVKNIHSRIIHQPKYKIVELFETLATKEDKMLATDKWPPMKLKDGKKAGSKGGHGPIRYTVQKYLPGEYIEFKFTKPEGFDGTHKFEILEIANDKTEIKHTIEMNVRGSGIITWTLAIRWLHDAYIEDAFDKVENHFFTTKKKTEWSIWVKILRYVLK